MKNHISLKSFKEAIKAQDITTLDKTITRDYQIKALDSDEREQFTFIITNDAMDRACDIVEPDGLDITNYLRNPVVLKIHNDQAWPIGKCVDLRRVDNGWQGTVQFCPGDYPVVGPDAEFCRRALRDGFISAVSIGFRALNYSINDEGGMLITESELLEFSIVPVPCHQEALLVPRLPIEESEKSIEIEEPVIPNTKKINRKRLEREIELAKIKLRTTK